MILQKLKKKGLLGGEPCQPHLLIKRLVQSSGHDKSHLAAIIPCKQLPIAQSCIWSPQETQVTRARESGGLLRSSASVNKGITLAGPDKWICTTNQKR